MKIEWVNNNKEFTMPKIKVGMDIDILTYMDKEVPKDLSDTVKRIMEYKETVYRILNLVDKNVKRETIDTELSTDEVGALYLFIRTNGIMKYTCPHCKKSFRYEDMLVEKKEGDTPLSEKKQDDITATKKETS